MNNVWLSAVLGNGKSRRKKYIVCNNDDQPLVFDTQLNAVSFWRNHKEKFDFPPDTNHRVTRVSPQVIRVEIPHIILTPDDLEHPQAPLMVHPDDVLFSMLDSGTRLALRPQERQLFYAGDDANNAEYLGRV